MKLQILFAVLSAVPALAAPINNDLADVATVLIGVADKRENIIPSKRDDTNVADVATVLIGVAEKRDDNMKRDESGGADDAPVLFGVADVAPALFGVADKRGAHEQQQSRRKRAVHGAYAKFVEEAEAHPEDVLG